MDLEKEDPLYSSRITNTYVEYLSKVYPDIDIDAILKYAKMTRYEVEDPGHWFTQTQVDRFHEQVVKETGNENIAREAGRFIASSERIGPVKQYSLGLLSLSNIYLMVSKLYTLMSRGANATATAIGSNKVEIIVTPKPGVIEKPYQCKNRIGIFESLAKLFAANFSKIEEISCFHKGDTSCHYLISWEDPPTKTLKKIRKILLVFLVLASIPFLYYLPFTYWIIFFLFCVSVTFILSYTSEHIEKIEKSNTIEAQGNAAEELVEEIDIRHNHALLVQKIGQATSKILDIDQLTNRVMGIISDHLDYDRGLILLADKNQSRLRFNSEFGYKTENKNQFVEISINIDAPIQNEIISKSFINQQPYLVNDLSSYNQKHALNVDFFKQLKSTALICIPIIYEKISLGILVLDNIKSKKRLAKSDMSLMIGVASQIAVGINNTLSFQKLSRSEKELQDSQNELERRVEERTSELEQANRDLNLEIEERQKTELRLRASIKEKDFLIHEVYHRVKNNLQIIASLLDMTKRRAKHPESVDMLSEAHAKIYTMSLIHTQLYQSERVDQINMGMNLRNLVDHLGQLYGQNRNVTTAIDTENFYLSVTQAVPCALALNEIISNAYKYAYTGNKTGKIEISQKISSDDDVTIIVKDYGKGIPDDIDIENTDTLGIKLIRNLIVKQLKGELHINNHEGTEITIQFKAMFEPE